MEEKKDNLGDNEFSETWGLCRQGLETLTLFEKKEKHFCSLLRQKLYGLWNIDILENYESVLKVECGMWRKVFFISVIIPKPLIVNVWVSCPAGDFTVKSVS